MRNILITISFITLLFAGACSNEQLGSLEQLAKGASLYDDNCANCHHKSGTGLAGLIPALEGSDYLVTHKNELPCIIQNGLSGEIFVNGKGFKLSMPGNKKLTTKEIAAITAYIHKKFLKETLVVTDTAINEALINCKTPAK